MSTSGPPGGPNPGIRFTMRSAKSLLEIERGLREAATRRKSANNCRIHEVCNPGQAKKVVEAKGASLLPYLAGSRCLRPHTVPTTLMEAA